MSEDRPPTNPPASPNSPVSRRRASWRVRVFAVAFSVGMAIIVAEIAMRLIGLDFASPYQPDAYCGSRLNANAGFWNLSEGRVYVATNAAAFRDREHSLQKPAGTIRIAVLGDSFAEAAQVKREDAFWSVMERELAKCPDLQGQTVEVLNFGISGYGTTQELQMLRHYVWPYEPDIVLLAFLPGNDVRNNSRELEPDRGRPFYDLVDGQLILDESFRDAPETKRFRESTSIRIKDTLLRNVRVLSAVYRAKENLKASWQATAVTTGEAGLDDGVFCPPRDAKWENAWAITEGVIGLMHDEVRAHGAKFFVVELNNAVQVHPDPAFIETAAKRLNTNDLEEPDRRLSRLAADRGFSFLSLTEPMRTIAQRDQIYFHGFPNTSPGSGHWNEQGHVVAGKLMAKMLCDSGWMEAR
jgi:hypothetical protein